MMGEIPPDQNSLFYDFCLDQHVPPDHLLRQISQVLGNLRQHLRSYYSHTGRPSIDPELMIRMLIVGYCYIYENNITSGDIELEITETALMHDPDRAISILDRISALGVKLSIDDFGTGYSSLSYLRRLPIQTLRIDRVFVHNMVNDVQDAIIVRSTIGLAHNLNLKVIAEGVEDSDTLSMLREMGCDEAQGYHFSKPKDWNEINNWLSEFNSP